MKRLFLGLFFSISFIAILSSFSLAITPHVCNATGLTNDTILSLYDYTNSHGALWNDSMGTPIEICYNETFGKAYDPSKINAGVHDCTGSNLVLTLSSVANAHANAPGQTPYPIPICYGDLACQWKSSACSNDERELLSLSTPTNAHLERPEMNGYQYRICCTSAWAGISSGATCGNGVAETGEQCDGADVRGKTCNDFGFSGGTLGCYASGGPNQCTYNTASCTGSTSVIGEVHWEDSAGTKIGRSVNIGTYVNRTVKVVANSNFPSGITVTFNVKEDDTIIGDSGDDSIKTVTAQTDALGRAVATFKITDADIAAGDDILESTSQEFYFTASAATSSSRSEIVDVDESQGPNTPPVANITAPIHRGVYYNNTSVWFNQSSYDLEGGLTFNWTIAEDNYKDNRSTFLYAFTKPGMKTVTLRVTDDRGAWDEQEVTILVVASPGMLAYINMPFNKQVVPAQSNGILSLSYAANESFVVNNNVINAGNCATGVTCLAGNCPSQTQNSPSYCPGPGGPIPINNAPKSFASTTFNWTIGNDGMKVVGAGDNYALGGRLFSKDQAGPQSLSLLLSYNDTVVGINQNAYRTFTMGQCVDNGHTFIRINLNTSKETSRGSTTSSDYCTGQNGAIGGGDDCCPAGFSCSNSGGPTKCYGNNITSCSQYTEISACENANPAGFPEYTQSRCGETVNGSVIDCECSWKASSSSCFLNVSSRNNNCGSSCDGAPSNYQCNVLSYTEHECVNGYADVDIIREFIPGTDITNPNDPRVVPACINETITGVLCGRPSFDLDFESNWTVFISALFIAGIYIVFYAFRKNGNK